MKKVVLFWGLLVSGVIHLNAQSFEISNLIHDIHPGELTVQFGFNATSCLIEAKNLSEIEYWYQNRWHKPIPGHHPEIQNQSDPIIFIQPEKQLLLRSKNRQEVRVHAAFAPNLRVQPIHYKVKPHFCDRPFSISPEIWRTGLPEPKKGRTENLVNHCIVHHSAGSNFNTDYVNVIRNIYLLHTQSNGWDDIGYNYLIAQNGDLFIGRDPQGVATEDNITGAHFCGKNTGTMGICLLGTYTDTLPSDTTFETLQHLLTWKLMKEELSATGNAIHPDGSSLLLPVIAGHRDGCATECPGEMVYQKLEKIREVVANQLDSCSPFAGFQEFNPNGYMLKKTQNLIQLENITHHTIAFKVYNNSGSLIEQKWIEPNVPYRIKLLNPGIYYLRIHSEMGTFIEKFCITEDSN